MSLACTCGGPGIQKLLTQRQLMKCIFDNVREGHVSCGLQGVINSLHVVETFGGISYVLAIYDKLGETGADQDLGQLR